MSKISGAHISSGEIWAASQTLAIVRIPIILQRTIAGSRAWRGLSIETETRAPHPRA
jgi:hypothetical protein